MEEQQDQPMQEISETLISNENQAQVKSESVSEASDLQPQENQPLASTSSKTNTPPVPNLSSIPIQTPIPQTAAQANISVQISNQVSSTPTQSQASVTPAPTTPIVNAPNVSNVQQQSSQAQAPPPVVRTEWDEIRLKLQENPHKTDLWIRYRDYAEDSGDLDKIKEAYEAMLEKYPNNSSVQIAYLNHFLTSPASLFCESLFARFLRTSPSVDLWKIYIHYVRRIKSGPEMRDTIRKAYEFALSHVGQDKDSGEIWMEYIAFLKSGEATTTWEEQQKMDALRKVYHRAVQIPLENVEAIWRELDQFENGLNKITAKKFLSDLTPSYMTAKTVLRDLRRHLLLLYPPPPPPPYSTSPAAHHALNIPQKPVFTSNERALVALWKTYLKWEESNPLVIEDKQVLFQRIQGVYRKALVRMRFYAEIWDMAYLWTKGMGKEEEAVNILKAGIEANPSSYLLNVRLAESQELANDAAGTHATFEKYLGVLRDELELLDAEATSNPPQSVSTSNASVPDPAHQDIADSHSDPNGGDTANNNGAGGNGNGAVANKTDPMTPHARMIAERRREYGATYVIYIRFALRHEGVDASRAAFAKARKDRWTPWVVFEAAAMMEYHSAKQIGIANRILGVAYSKFSDDVEFVNRYLAFLIAVNDENNARALFERAITTIPPEKARPLWERWGRYEHMYGSLEASLKLEKRMAEVYPNDTAIKRFAQRNSYLNIDVIAGRDLGFSMMRQQSQASSNSSQGSSGISAPGGGGLLGRTETLSYIPPGPGSGSSSMNQSSTSNSKRPSPQEMPLRRDDGRGMEHGPPHKRSRPLSPPPRERERERWDGRDVGPKSLSRRFGSPAWDRERSRDRSPPPRRGERDRGDDGASGSGSGSGSGPKQSLPVVLSRFVGMLPSPVSFDGPVFRTDDLMQVFRNAIIPASSGIRPRSPLGPPRTARPPPDYSPYQGPSAGPSRGGRRY